MLDRAIVDRLRAVDAGGSPVISLYLGIGPDVDELRSIPARIKALIAPLRQQVDAGVVPAEHARALKADLDQVAEMAESLGGDLGRGAALFVSTAAGLSEHLALPAGVRDRAVIGTGPYLVPLDAMLDHFGTYCAVVLDRRTASIYRFHMGALESWETIGEEEIRKDNFGGFQGNAERRVRGHAETVARRLFKLVSDRLALLARAGEFDLLTVGGGKANVDNLLAELPPDVATLLAGTFAIDPRTASPADVRERCREVAEAHEQVQDARLIEEVREAAGGGGRGAIGIGPVLDALNQRAVDRLLVAAQRTEPGFECTACGWLGVGDDPGCPSCGAPLTATVDLIDAATRLARDQGAAIRFLLGDSPLSGDRLAALLRHRVGPVA